MKLYRRYLLAQVRRPWLYVLAGFSAMAVLADLFNNFSDFFDGATPVSQILLYYAVFLPTSLVYVLPVSILLALLYALWELGKNSEITAMRACGLSIPQIISPFIGLGAVCAIALFVINEFFNPWAMLWTRQFKENQHQRRIGQAHLVLNFAYKNVPSHRLWRLDSFNPAASDAYEMRGLVLDQHRPDGTREYHREARRAIWRDGHWWAEDVATQFYGPDNEPDGPIERAMQLDMPELSETPTDFLNEIKDPDTERSAADIRRFLATHDVSRRTRNRYLVDWHSRMAAPWLCVIVVFLGVPFGLHTNRRGMGLGILFALLTFFGYYVLYLFCLYLGKDSQSLPPLLAGWLPNLLFSALGLSLLYRIR